MSAQIGLHAEYMEDLVKARYQEPRFLILHQCDGPFNATDRCTEDRKSLLPYPQVLQESEFCLVVRKSRLGQLALSDAMKAGCIPVIVADSYVLPFLEVIDWKRYCLS
jgi:glucuronyl/N-acetylglucosaminyl transferase EXT2